MTRRSCDPINQRGGFATAINPGGVLGQSLIFLHLRWRRSEQ
jgi:hypothetical protein